MRSRTLWALLLLTAALPYLAPAAHADSRTQHPLQIQFDTGGLTLGYHFSERIYVGVTQQPRILTGYSYGRRHADNSEHEIYEQNNVHDVDLEFAPRTSLEARWSPWAFGLYFAAGVLATGADRQTVAYRDVPRVIGKTAYQSSSLKVDVKDQAQTALAGGVGFNHVFPSGFSLAAGFLVALRESDTPGVTVTEATGNVSQADLDRFNKKVVDANRGPQGMLHLAIGWNF